MEDFLGNELKIGDEVVINQNTMTGSSTHRKILKRAIVERFTKMQVVTNKGYISPDNVIKVIKIINDYKPASCEKDQQIADLEKQLAEKEKEIVCYEHTIEQYEHELEVYKHNDNIYANSIRSFANKNKQDKIEFAIAELEKVKEFYTTPIYDRENAHTEVAVLLQRIDQQIKELKGVLK